MWTWTIVRFLHVTAAAVWVGMQVTLMVLIPHVRRTLGADVSRDIVRSAARRLLVTAAVALPTLLGTGIALASHEVPQAHRGWVDLKVAMLVAIVAVLAGHGIVRTARLRILLSALMLLFSLIALFAGVHLTEL
jgi:uncharacterized membrane protein